MWGKRIALVSLLTLLAACNGDAEDSSNDAVAVEPGQGGGTSKAPRLVLFDADGDPVDAVVESLGPVNRAVSAGEDVTPIEYGRGCAALRSLGDAVLPYAMRYRLEDGRMESCAQPLPRVGLSFRDAECTEPIYSAQPATFNYEGQIMWPAGEATAPDSYYRLSYDGACAEQEVSDGAVFLPLVPVPEQFTDALDNPPYEVRAMY